MGDQPLSIGDDFLDARFDPKYKEIFKEKFELLGSEPVKRSYIVPTEFEGDFPHKIETLLQNFIQQVFRLAESYQLSLQKTDPRIVFFTYSGWKDSHHNEKKSLKNLPASVIKWRGRYPTVQIIVPDQINSSETIIKIVRLLISNLFGKLYFEEHLKNTKKYKRLQPKSFDLDISQEEKSFYCRIFDSFPAPLEQKFFSLAKQARQPKSKAFEFGKNLFFRSFESDSPSSEDNDLLDEAFLFHYKKSQQNREQFYQDSLKAAQIRTKQIGLILPHEEKSFKTLENKRQWALFTGIEEKLNYLLGAIDDAKECYEYLKQIGEGKALDSATIDFWNGVLNQRILFLKKKNLVKLFLIEAANLSPNQKKEELEFPLWIWRKKLFRNFPEGSNSSVVIKKVTSQYKHSIYQKVFEAAFRAGNCLKGLAQNPGLTLSNSDDFRRLKSLIAGFEIRYSIMKELQFLCRIANQIQQTPDKDIAGVEESRFSIFEKGWSYFISFALLHQYYMHRDDKSRQKGKKFQEIVTRHLINRLEKDKSSQVSFLLLNIYLNHKSDLNLILALLNDDSKGLGFFIDNQNSIMKTKDDNREILLNYAERLH